MNAKPVKPAKTDEHTKNQDPKTRRHSRRHEDTKKNDLAVLNTKHTKLNHETHERHETHETRFRGKALDSIAAVGDGLQTVPVGTP